MWIAHDDLLMQSIGTSSAVPPKGETEPPRCFGSGVVFYGASGLPEPRLKLRSRGERTLRVGLGRRA